MLLRWLKNLFSAKSRPQPTNEQSLAYTRPANWEDVLTVTRLLNRHQVRYILVGGYALAAHGYVRMTEDVDIAVAATDENASRWIIALSELPDGAARELQGEQDPFEGDHLHAIRLNDEFTIDLLPSVSGISFEELERHTEILDLDGEPIPVLSLKGLLLTKQGLRPKDQADAVLLQRALEMSDKPEPTDLSDDSGRNDDHGPSSV